MTDISATTSARTLLDLTDPRVGSEAPSNQLDKDAFLKLLVAQLRYQDPLNPSNPEDFMATTAQFTTIEKLDELTQQGANNAIVTGLSMASSLVGRQVDYIDPNGVAGSSVVTSAQVVNGAVRLMTDDGPVDLATVTGIGLVDSAAQDSAPAEATAAEDSAPAPAEAAAAEDSAPAEAAATPAPAAAAAAEDPVPATTAPATHETTPEAAVTPATPKATPEATAPATTATPAAATPEATAPATTTESPDSLTNEDTTS